MPVSCSLVLHGLHFGEDMSHQSTALRTPDDAVCLPAVEPTLHQILRNTQDGIVLIDRNCRILEWNPAQERITGIQREEALGEPIYDVIFRTFPPERRSIELYLRHRRLMEAYLEGEAPVEFDSIVEHQIMRSDGSRRTIQNSHFIIEAEAGRMAGSIVRDITAQARAEIAERETLRLQADFINSVSHSMRTPLHNLQGFLEIVSNGKVSDPQLKQEFVSRALTDAQHLSALVNDLVDTAEFERGEIDLDMRRVDIRQVIEGAMASVKQMARERSVPVAYAPAHRDLDMHANPLRLRQVVVSLLKNAIQISPAGSPVLVTSHTAEAETIVQVIDQGPGIPSEIEPAIFDRHYSRDDPPSASGSTGLGLYLSKRIIEAHGGRIGVRSQMGVGTTFYFSIPLHADGS